MQCTNKTKLFSGLSTFHFAQEREEREEIEKELRAQSETLNLIRPLSSDEGSNGAGSGKDEAHKVVENTNNNTDSLLRRSPSSSAASSLKEPPPLGLAGLEAFRREYLTSPLSHLRAAAAANPRDETLSYFSVSEN